MMLTFNPGPSSQGGLDLASAMLQQRLGQMGADQQMNNLYRRDPRAATALIQSQMAAQESAADRMQRGDLAAQEMDLRNRSLDAQTRAGADDRLALMERLREQLRGQRDISGDRMDFEGRMEQQRQAAAALEQERNRTLQSQLQQSQQAFQGGLADKQMQHSGGLAKDQAALAREQMLNDLTMKRAELLGLDKRAQDDLRGRMMAEFAGAAASTNAEDFPIIQKRFMDMLAQGTPGAAPAAAPPRLAIDTVDPTLRGAWDKLSTGKDGATKKSVAEFIKSIPEVDRKTHRDALRTYIQTRYPDAMQNQSYGSPFSSRAAVNDELRAELGESPQGNLWSDLRAANPLGLMLDPLAATPQGRVEAGQRLLSKFNPF